MQVAPGITTADHTTFVVGSAGTFTVTTTGLPTAALSDTGALPTGVTFTDNGDGTATLAGTPAAGTGGIYHFTHRRHQRGHPGRHPVLHPDRGRGRRRSRSGNHATFTVGSAGTFTVTTHRPSRSPTLSETGALPTGVTLHRQR